MDKQLVSSQRAENAVDAAVAAYNTAVSAKPQIGFIELELRLDQVSAEEFAAIKAGATAKFGEPRVERSANIIASKPGKTKLMTQNIITHEHSDKGKIPPRYTSKTRITQPSVTQRNSVQFRIGISREEPIEAFIIIDNATVRFKVRYSFEVVMENTTWSLDMTIVKRASISNGEAELKRIKQEMFEVANPHPEDAAYEIEIELKSVGGKLRASDLNVVDTIAELINPDHVQNMAYQRAIHEAAISMQVQDPNRFFSPKNRLKQLVPQVEALSRITYRQLGSVIGYWSTLKLDGERCIVHVVDHNCTIIMADSIHVFSTTTPMHGVTLADGEIIGLMSNAQTAGAQAKQRTGPITIHLFDTIIVGDVRAGADIAARIDQLPAAAAIINRILGPAGKCVPKEYVKITEVERDISAVWNGAKKSTVPVDGIIISEPGKSYHDTRHYKWKPTDQNTIDFMIVKCPESLLGVSPYAAGPDDPPNTYLLFVGIDHGMRSHLGIGLIRNYRELFPDVSGKYYPIQFSPSVNPLAYIWHSDIPDLHGKIGEFSLSGERDCADCDWVFHRVRNDRRAGANYYGNNYKVAETIFMNYIDDFPLEMLWEPSDDLYFEKAASSIYTASNSYKRSVIGSMFSEYLKDVSQVFDAAAGRGADLPRYRKLGTRVLLATDIVSANIAELVDRKYTARRITGSGLYARSPGSDVTRLIDPSIAGSTTVYAAVMDLTRPVDELLARCVRYGYRDDTVTAFVCNFALHYFCTDSKTLSNFMQFASTLMQVGARAIFTIMNGEAVANALVGPKNKHVTWQVVEDGEVKYMIKYLKAANVGEPFGSMIEIKLPFSDKLMSEPLCYIEAVERIAIKFGLKLIANVPFSSYVEEFARSNASIDRSLTQGDRDYIAMHSCIVFEKCTQTKSGAYRRAGNTYVGNTHVGNTHAGTRTTITATRVVNTPPIVNTDKAGPIRLSDISEPVEGASQKAPRRVAASATAKPVAAKPVLASAAAKPVAAKSVVTTATPKPVSPKGVPKAAKPVAKAPAPMANAAGDEPVRPKPLMPPRKVR